jgi:hypothetical protein
MLLQIEKYSDIILIMEIWKKLESVKRANGVIRYYEDYEVSNYGRVRSYKRKEPAILKGHFDPAGYINHMLADTTGKHVNVRAHTLVIQTFLGYPEDGMVVCHYDDVKTNNRLDNLRYDTRKANWKDIVRNKNS